MPFDLLRWLARVFPHGSFHRVAAIQVRDGLIHYRRVCGQAKMVPWHSLNRVFIRTTDRGPFDEDVFFVLETTADTLIVSQDAPGCEELLGELQSLPGFRNEAVIEAMACTDNREFPCWERTPMEPGA